MTPTLSGAEPEQIGALFFASYVLLWWMCLDTTLWLLTSSAMSFMFLRFALALSADQRDTIPPVALILACIHWGILYLSLLRKAR